jgi:hypothetical protein
MISEDDVLTTSQVFDLPELGVASDIAVPAGVVAGQPVASPMTVASNDLAGYPSAGGPADSTPADYAVVSLDSNLGFLPDASGRSVRLRTQCGCYRPAPFNWEPGSAANSVQERLTAGIGCCKSPTNTLMAPK